MTATVTHFPTRLQDPALQAALAELLQLGLAVARVVSHLANVEDESLHALAAVNAAAARILVAGPTSLEEALRAGREIDDGEAARNAAAARVAVITDSFEKTARAIRRTAALQARLASGRPFPDAPSPAGPQDRPAHQPATTTCQPPGTDPAEHPDRPETGDELGTKTDEELLQDIRRDLAGFPPEVTRLPELLPFAPNPAPAAPDPFPDGPPGPIPAQAAPPGPLPAPDT